MKTKELGVIAAKITGIACMVVAVFKLQRIIITFVEYQAMRMHTAGYGLVALAMVLSFAIIFLAGLGLFLGGDRVGPFITRAETEIPFPRDGDAILRIGVAIVGIWAMAIAIPAAIEKLSYVVLLNKSGIDTAPFEMKVHYLPGLIAASAQTAIGAWMFFGSRGIVGIRNVVREAGHKRREKADGQVSDGDAPAAPPPDDPST